MSSDEHSELTFARQTVSAKFIDPAGQLVERPVEIRTNPHPAVLSEPKPQRIQYGADVRGGPVKPP